MHEEQDHHFGEESFAIRYTETHNKRTTHQCACQLHAHLELDRAEVVLEVGAGAGLGALDIATRMKKKDLATRCKKLVVTDFAPAMVRMAKENLRDARTSRLEIDIREANCEDLEGVADDSVDRYVCNFFLHGADNPDTMLREAKRVLKSDGMAGFTIWSEESRSGAHVIGKAVSEELGLGEDVYSHDLFWMGRDLDALQVRFHAAGFSQVRMWPYQCVIENWSTEAFAEFQEQLYPSVDDETREKKADATKRLAKKWFESGRPIGYEAYIIVAKP